MIYTVTANPSIDYIVQINQINIGEINRSHYDAKLPGGKGINVTRILKELGADSTALGFVGNATGAMFEKLLETHHLITDFTQVKDDTRINVKVKADDNETEINGTGPNISTQEQEELLNQIRQLTSEDIVIVSGSLARGLTPNFYLEIAKIANERNAEFVIDTTGQSLLETLTYQPFVIKPNHHELAELFNVELKNDSDIIIYAKKLLQLGAKNVLVSMAGDGAILVTPEHNYKCNAPKGTVINSVGAGDSMIAGFVGTYMQTHDFTESFKKSAACGSATAFSEDLATKDKIDEIYSQITVSEI
ncbi:tagatose-6-phosphate kinase [Companilactobacillus sp. RD055328]|uniref:1-phosphofructokinase n=1 Tax=Companilactobacillus sp. RD055328 TaxID=2916634 RepID=UPI001FC8510C|nr:1-phosphofructokinase [Companilactobacillus sp. RD055328]GKQ42770.1 tagatose-6-phosphate kinase [Companilactobacillus sp. RD055328]